jgi:hypothetical protein
MRLDDLFGAPFLRSNSSASSLVEDEVIPSLDAVEASAEPINDVRPAAAAAPTSATVPRKSRRPMLLLIYNPICLGSRTAPPFPATGRLR